VASIVTTSDIAYRVKKVRALKVQMFKPTRMRNVVIKLFIFTSCVLNK